MIDKQKLYNLTLVFPSDSLDAQIEVYDLVHDERESYELFKAWHEFFVRNNFDITIITKFFDTYWKWYVMVTWKNFACHNEKFLSEFMPYQFMMAYRLGFSVPSLYANHVVAYIPEDSVQDELHASIVERIKNSNLPFDYHTGRSLMDLINTVKKIDTLDTFTRSELYATVENFIFDDEDETSAEEKIARVDDLFEFLKFVSDPKAIAEFRKLYTDSAPYLPSNLMDHFLSEWTPEGEDEEDVQNEKGISATESILEESENEDEGVLEVEEKATTLQDIQSRILNDLKNTSEDPEEFILNKLQEYSVQKNDPRILDLYYFDEKTGTFIWNDELLTES